MTEDDVLTAHGFSRAQCVRAIAKPLKKRSDREQAMIAALVGFRKETGYYANIS